MTGYLKSLARRTVDDTTVLRPRLPSQFERNFYALAQPSFVGLQHDDLHESDSEHVPKSLAAHVPNSDGSDLPSPQADESQVSLSQETQRWREPRQHVRLTPGEEQTDGKIGRQVNLERGTKENSRQYSPALSVRSNEEGDERPAAPLRFEHADDKRPVAQSVQTSVETEAVRVRNTAKKRDDGDRMQMHRANLDFPIEDSRQHFSAQTTNVDLHATQPVLTKRSPMSAAEDKTNVPNVLMPQPRGDSSVAARTIVALPAIEPKAMGKPYNADKFALPGHELFALQSQQSLSIQPKAIQPVLPIQPQMPSTRAAVQPQQIVNVNIGRIEIKAVPIDERPRKRTQNRSSAMMSLDEYLNQHAMGSSQ